MNRCPGYFVSYLGVARALPRGGKSFQTHSPSLMRARFVIAVAAVLWSSPALAQAKKELPLKLAPRPTKAAVTAEDLMTRLYIYADDSMQGRRVRSEGNVRATKYLAAELKRLGLQPAGDNGTYFQTIPFETIALDPASKITVNGKTLIGGTDFSAGYPSGKLRNLENVPVVYAGSTDDTASLLPADAGAGKIVVINVAPKTWPSRQYKGAVAVIQTVDSLRAEMGGARPAIPHDVLPGEATLTIMAKRSAVETLLGTPIASAKPGPTGSNATISVKFTHTPSTDKPPAYNVVGIIPGTDPALKGTYVAIGAHLDHVGIHNPPVDHDSARVARQIMKHKRDSIGDAWPNPMKDWKAYMHMDSMVRASIQVNVDSLRKIRPARLDSISNGADDDGSGTVTVLEVAEALAKLPAKPKRSVIVVFHNGEEAGLLGAKYFTAFPTVPRDSIIAQVNIDMVGRGSKEDTPEGGPNMVMVIGADRISSDLGKTVEDVNEKTKDKMRLDYTWSAPDHPENVYFRSDHYEYAKYGIPIAFFFTGLHIDYHAITDEPQYIDYDHMEKIGKYIYDLMMALGNRPTRLNIDKPVS
jgi:hypothetical protein